jgi:hypothetical protein
VRVSPRFLTRLSAGAIFAILVATLWGLSREPPPLQVQRLPDGSVLRLEAVTTGTGRRVVLGRYWQRLLVMALPSARRLIGDAVLELPTSRTGDVVFWTSAPLPAPGPPSSLGAVFFDEHGCEFPAGAFWGALWRQREVDGWTAQAFPRRGRRLGLRLYRDRGSSPSVPMAELTVPNPAPGPYPTWKGQPTPISRQDGGLTFTLTSLATGLKERGPVRPPAARGQGTWTCATVRMTGSGRAAEGQQLYTMTLSDATGNEIIDIGFHWVRATGETHFLFLGSLGRDEAAWKARVECSRFARFPPADLWTVQGVAVPAPGAVTSCSTKTTRHGVTLELMEIAGPGATIAPEEGLRPEPSLNVPTGRHCISVRALSPPNGLQLGRGLRVSLVRMTGERGRPISLLDRDASASISSSGRHRFEVTIPSGTKRVDLTFAVSKSRFVEFMAQPSWGWSEPRNSDAKESATARR